MIEIQKNPQDKDPNRGWFANFIWAPNKLEIAATIAGIAIATSLVFPEDLGGS